MLKVVAPSRCVDAMAGDSISGATDFVIISTTGRHVVLNISFSEHFNALKFIPARLLVMTESSRVLNTFPNPVQRDSLLHLMFHQDVPIHLNEKFDHRRHVDAPVVTLPPFSVFEYLKRYTICFDVGCIYHTKIDGNKLQVWDRFGERLDTAVAE